MNKVKKTLAWIGIIIVLLLCLITLAYLIIYDRKSLLGIFIAALISTMFIWAIEEVTK